MDMRNYIKNCVRAYGCVPIDGQTLQEIWPDRGYGTLPWDHEALIAWCEENRIDADVDYRRRMVRFTPAGIEVPMFA
jgi:hypothetical protein